jgi:hypothetical protein
VFVQIDCACAAAGFGTLEMAKSSPCATQLQSEPEEGWSFALQNGERL